MNKAFKLLRSFFFPERCPYCNKRIEYDKIACENCRSQFPEVYCINYVKGGYPCCSPFFYKDIFADAVKNFKFRGALQSSEKLSAVLADCIKKSFDIKEIDIITFVPMHRKKQKIRGYNQSEILARDVSKILGIPCEKLINKTKENMEQHKCISQTQRRDNVKGVYEFIDNRDIKGKTILVIDDIITTGYTLGECAKILSKHSKAKILCATVCAKNNIYT